MRTWNVLCLMVCALTLGGCWQVEPRYRLADVAFDPTLIGRWEQVEPRPADGQRRATIEVQERELEVKEGRVQPPWEGARRTTPSTSTQTAHAYRLVFRSEGSDEAPLRFNAFLLSRGGHSFIGLQIAPDESRPGIIPFYALPVHFLLLCERRGESLTLRMPRCPIVWIPMVRSLDPAAAGAPDIPQVDQLSADEGIPFTPDVDRLLRIYAGHAGDANFWEDPPRVYQRVVSAASPPLP